jgi:hypothetical protein
VNVPDALLCIDDLYELLALYRMLFDRKFDGAEDEFFGSPYIAAVQRRLLQALMTAEPHRGWHTWADAAQHGRVLAEVRSYLQRSPRVLARMSPSQWAYVQDLLSPLTASPDLVDELAMLASPES